MMKRAVSVGGRGGNLMRTVAVAAVALFMAGLAGVHEARGQYADFTDKFEMNDECWPDNSKWNVDMESKVPIMGVTWKTHAFQFVNGRLSTGIRTLDYVATLGSTAPLERGVKRVVVEETIFDYDLNISKLRAVRLLMSPNADFSGAKVYANQTVPVNAVDPFVFDIDAPAPGMYYRIEVDFLGGGQKDCWFKLDRLKFYDMTWNSVETVTDDCDGAEPEWYTLQGVRVAEPGRGVYIRRVGGRAAKVAF